MGDALHSHDTDSEACLNRQTLNNSVERKAIEGLSDRPLKLTHKAPQLQHMDTDTYIYIRHVSSNMHRTRSCQLLPLATDIEETHEALIAVRGLMFC